MQKLMIKKLDERAKVPAFATEGAAGADLYVLLDEPLTLMPGERALLPTGIAMAIPEGLVGLVFARSGLAVKHGITLSNCVGVIDSDYRGELKIGVINQGGSAYTIEPFERVAQMVLTPFVAAEIEPAGSLPETKRGEGGFGSSGTR